MEKEAVDPSTLINSKLLTRAINFHGHELMRALQTEQGEEFLAAVDARSINYVQYHQQAQQQEFHLRYKKQKLLQFIAKKAGKLFMPFDGELPIVPDKEAESLFAVLPPLEEYMEVPALERRRLFYQTLEKGDYVIGQVKSLSASGYFVTLLCLDGGKKMFIHDLGVKTVLLSTVIPIKPGDLVRAAVHGYTRNTQKVLLSFTYDVKRIPEMNLGVITSEELPSHYRDSLEKHTKFTDLIKQRVSFWNPSAVQNLCKYFGIPNSGMGSSLMKHLCNSQYPEEECSVYLHKIQSSHWAAGNVARGVEYIKEAKSQEALQCLSNALKIDPNNTEALIARGTVFANIKCLRKAIEDFEKALSLEPSNIYAKKHLSDTRLVVGKILAQKGDVDGSLENFTKSVELNAENEEALALMKAVLIVKNTEAKSAASKEKTSPSNSILDTRDKLKHLIEEEQKMKLKMKRHSSVSSPSSSSASNQETGSSCSKSKKAKYSSKQMDDKHKLMCEQFLELNRKRLAESRSNSRESKRHRKHSYKQESEKHELKVEKGHRMTHPTCKSETHCDRHKKHLKKEEDVKSDKRHKMGDVVKCKSDRHSEGLKRKGDVKVHASYKKPEIEDHEWISSKKHMIDVDIKIEEKSRSDDNGKAEIKKRFERNMYAEHFSHHPDTIAPDKDEKMFEDKSIVHMNTKDPGFSEQSKQKVFFVLRNDQESKAISKGLLRDNSVAHCFRDDSDEEDVLDVQPEASRKPSSLFKKPTLFLPRKYRSNNSGGGGGDEEEDTRTPKPHETSAKVALPLQDERRIMQQHHYHYELPRHYGNENPEKFHFERGSGIKNEFHMHENLSSKPKFNSLYSSGSHTAPKISNFAHYSLPESFHKNADSGIRDSSSTTSEMNVELLNSKLKGNTRESVSHSVASSSSVSSRRLSAVDVFKHDLMKS